MQCSALLGPQRRAVVCGEIPLSPSLPPSLPLLSHSVFVRLCIRRPPIAVSHSSFIFATFSLLLLHTRRTDTHTCIIIIMHTHTCTCTNTCIHTHTHTHTHTHIQTYTHAHKYIRGHIHKCTCTHTRTHTDASGLSSVETIQKLVLNAFALKDSESVP